MHPSLDACHLQLMQGPLGLEKLIIAIKNISYLYHRSYIRILCNTLLGINPYSNQVFYNGDVLVPCTAISMNTEMVMAKSRY